MAFLFLVLNIVLLVSIEGASPDLPAYFPKCHRSDPKLNDCLLQATETVVQYLRNGVPDIKFPIFRPYVLPTYKLDYSSPTANITGSLNNIVVVGFDKYKFKEVKYDTKTSTIHAKFDLEPVALLTNFVSKGRMLNMVVDGTGFAEMKIGPISATVQINGAITSKNGEQYYSPQSCTVKLIIDNLSFKIDGLKKDPVEAQQLNGFLNKESKRLATTMTPFYEKFAQAMFLDYMKTLTKTISYDKLLPLK